MADHVMTSPSCPSALCERECTTKDVTSCVLTNNNDGFSTVEQDSSALKGHLASQISENRENGDVQCNGKTHSHLHPPIRGANSEALFDATSNGKKLNGLIHNEYNLNDNGIVKNLVPVVSEGKEDDCSDASKQIPKTSATQKMSSNCDVSSTEGKTLCCASQSSNTRHNEVDDLLRKLEDVSVVPSSSNNLDENEVDRHGIEYIVYESEKQMPDIMRLITKDLSEPYSIYTYRYFIHNWPRLCFLAKADDQCVGAIVCKLDLHKKMVRRGYIAMLAVDSEYRRRQIGSTLVTKAIEAMIKDDCDEVVLETEITNQGALRLYENLGFVRDKRLFRYYLNGVDALRLKLWLR